MEILAITLSLFWHTQNEGISTILTHFTENQIQHPISNITIFNFYPFFQLRITYSSQMQYNQPLEKPIV